MSTYRGSKGFVALGGIVTGSPLIAGAVAQGASTAVIDGAPLTGVLLSGDKFTVAGDAQVYTISADVVIGDPTPNQASISFTPTVQEVGGWADNAAVSFTANSLAQVTAWNATPSRPVLDQTVMGDGGKRITLDQPGWSGSIEALFDYGDAEQAEFVDEVKGNAEPAGIGVVLGTATDKQLYGHIRPTNAAVTSQRGAIVTVSMSFEGNAALALDW